MKKHIIALDIGTQSVRAALIDVSGEILGLEQIKQEVDTPHPNWAQQRPESWWEKTGQAIRNLFSRTSISADSVAVISACGQMHGPVGIREDGVVTTPWVQLWCDKRCEQQVEQVFQTHDESQLAAISANPVNPAWTGLKVRWIRENEPEAYARTRWFLVPKDFINFKLTGVAATDPSEASGSFLWDCGQDDYSKDLANAVGLDLERFPPVLASHEVIGAVTEEASKETGIRVGTPTVAGGGDFPVSMLGFGMVGEGIAADVTGTSTLLASHSPRPLIHSAVQNLRHVVEGWIPFTILDCGGLSMTWLKDLVDSTTPEDVSFESLIETASVAPVGSDGLFFLPYMLGERARGNTGARGTFVGITLDHKAPHLIRSVMEGVALAMGRDTSILRGLDLTVDRVFCAGGGARNDLWNQIKANILEVPVEIASEPEAGLKGAALLGASGVGLIEDPAIVAQERRETDKTFRPQPETFDRYRNALTEYNRIYDHMFGFWQ
jgi:xylulokinase